MIFPKLHISIERWKWNEEYQIYVSNFGNFKDKNKKDIKQLVRNGYMYPRIKKKLKSAHRIVMETWRPIENMEDMTIDHLDHNTRKNCLSNLEWVTLAENHRRAREDELALQELTNKTFTDFYLKVNNCMFETIDEAATYAKTQMNYLDACVMRPETLPRIFEKLINAYNNQNEFYVKNGFKKEKYNCVFSIVEKGVR